MPMDSKDYLYQTADDTFGIGKHLREVQKTAISGSLSSAVTNTSFSWSNVVGRQATHSWNSIVRSRESQRHPVLQPTYIDCWCKWVRENGQYLCHISRRYRAVAWITGPKVGDDSRTTKQANKPEF